MCQCPERGDLHFYNKKRKYVFQLSMCVNALKGATSISTNCCVPAMMVTSNVCQCPERGDLHFYQ